MNNHPFTLTMPPNNITILAICTVMIVYMCREEGCMQASTPPHTKHKLTRRVMITLLPPEVTCTQTHARTCFSITSRARG